MQKFMLPLLLLIALPVYSQTIPRPSLSFVLDDKLYRTSDSEAVVTDTLIRQAFDGKIRVSMTVPSANSMEWKCNVVFENIGNDTVILSNVVPFGENRNSVYITAFGPPDLTRAGLFRPGFRPVKVILPDNAWEIGYSSFNIGGDLSVCAIARRQKTEGGQKRRYETLLPPVSRVTYTIHADLFSGEWQNGLKKIFRDKLIYDLDKFDNSLFERKDLEWVRGSYLMVLNAAWDIEFYNRLTGKYTYAEFLKKYNNLFGSIDAFMLWPTWPRLGLDERNQWDLFRDLPGGTVQLRNFARISRQYGTRFFINSVPWDNSTRKEGEMKGMAQLIAETEADGVVLDSRGGGSTYPELQAAADSVRKGVIMYYEGMPYMKDMQYMTASRVHNAIYLSPELNIDKLIKPDCSIFRVCDVGEDVLHREIAISFFNGYGTELNLVRPGGRNENFESDLDFLALTTFILRQNNDAFLDKDWTPLIETITDSVFVNKWNSGSKTIYTVLNMKADGFTGRLFRTDLKKEKHFVSLWNHENLKPETEGSSIYIPARAEGWLARYSGTRMEGSVECIAEFPEILKSKISGDSIEICAPDTGEVIIWKGNPSYQGTSIKLKLKNDTVFRVKDIFGYYEGKIVVQLLEGKLLKDENVLAITGGKPWLTTRSVPTKRATSVSAGMVLVPGATFSYNVSTGEDFVPYPDVSGREVSVDSFLIDKYPVTNAQYLEFIVSTGYVPADTSRYLRNWVNGSFRQGQDKYPVVYLSIEDMKAYAAWAGKRLPTEAEWQLAAQGTDKRLWPWGNEFHGTNCNNAFGRPTPVDAFSKGQSEYGVMDLVGNVWQMTNDLYFNGTNYFAVIRGGSYYNPESSWWYIKGGPQPLDKTQIMLLVAPGYDRSATVGFRCVRDIYQENFKIRK